MNHYITVRCEVPESLSEAAAYWLHEEGAEGVEVQDEELLRPAGGEPLAPGRARVIGFFGEGADEEAIVDRLRERLPDVEVASSREDDQPWADVWKLHFQPLKVRDDFWVLPPWEEKPEGARAIFIEPGMAFGTGGHESTALCLDLIPDVLEPGATVLDVGCGSGILGIAASELGAGRVVMVDIDPVAVEVAGENAEVNGHQEIETSGTPIEEVRGAYDLVLANILARPLIDMVPHVVARMAPGASLILSGIMVDQAHEVRDAYEAAGLVFAEERTMGEWSALRMVRER